MGLVRGYGPIGQPCEDANLYEFCGYTSHRNMIALTHFRPLWSRFFRATRVFLICNRSGIAQTDSLRYKRDLLP